MTEQVPTGFRSDFITANGVKLHVVHNGGALDQTPVDDTRKPLLMLHGFPEFWFAWEAVMAELRDEYFIIVPDQRGYNLSDAPAGVENYRAKLLVKDMIDLMQSIIGDKPFHLAGHDWGASIAYALAINFPQKIETLTIANGVHPVCFQTAILDDPKQAEASAYFHLLRSEKAPDVMVEDDFRRTFNMFEGFSNTPWMNNDIKDRYRKAWSDADRLRAMLHWYNSSPIVIPEEGKPVPDAPLYNAGNDKFRISMPHTLVWGMGDQALRPVCQEKLGDFCDDLTRIEIANGDHWLLHTHAKQVADAIRKQVG